MCKEILEFRFKMFSGFLICMIDQRGCYCYKIRVEKAFHFIPPYGIISAADNVVVFIYIIHDKTDSIFVIDQQIKLFHNRNRFLGQHPAEQGIDIIKMIIKRISVYAAVLYDLFYRNF